MSSAGTTTSIWPLLLGEAGCRRRHRRPAAGVPYSLDIELAIGGTVGDGDVYERRACAGRRAREQNNTRVTAGDADRGATMPGRAEACGDDAMLEAGTHRDAGIEKKVMPGAVTVTASGAAARKPVAVAFTVVEPAPIGSNATPPLGTDVGELV